MSKRTISDIQQSSRSLNTGDVFCLPSGKWGVATRISLTEVQGIDKDGAPMTVSAGDMQGFKIVGAYDKEQRVDRAALTTKLIGQLQGVPFSVTFNKKLDKNKIATILLAQDTSTHDSCMKLAAKVISGETRAMIAYLDDGFTACSTGFLKVCEVKTLDEFAADAKKKMRQVNLQTVNELIVNGVRFYTTT